MDLNIKDQIFDIFKTRFKSAGVSEPKEIFIYYEKDKRISVGYDNERVDEVGLGENLIMKNFLMAQVNKLLSSKHPKTKIYIKGAITTIHLDSKEIYLDVCYSLNNDKTELFYSHQI